MPVKALPRLLTLSAAAAASSSAFKAEIAEEQDKEDDYRDDEPGVASESEAIAYSAAAALYITNPAGIIYHHPAGIIHGVAVIICKGGEPPLMIYTLRVMIYQACGLDTEKSTQRRAFFWSR